MTFTAVFLTTLTWCNLEIWQHAVYSIEIYYMKKIEEYKYIVKKSNIHVLIINMNRYLSYTVTNMTLKSLKLDELARDTCI